MLILALPVVVILIIAIPVLLDDLIGFFQGE